VNILIVEDNPAVRKLIRRATSYLATEVNECEDGADALSAYATHQPDLVFMDIRMRRMDGLLATRETLRSYPQAFIVIVMTTTRKTLETPRSPRRCCARPGVADEAEALAGERRGLRPVAVGPVGSGIPRPPDLLIECNLPSEQFAAFASGAIPVTLQWRPPLCSDRITQAGLAFSLLPMIMWIFKKVRAQLTQHTAKNVGESAQSSSYSTAEEELHQLGIKLGESLRNQTPSSVAAKQVYSALAIQSAMSAHLVNGPEYKGMSQSEPTSGAPFADPMEEDVDRVLAHLHLSARDLSAVSQ
jgi:CheY-like chemotaxis protein